MQFDEFDKKIKQAADHHHPAYDEQAWTKMEKLLNKHLPQKEDDKRRFLFFLLLFLGLSGAGLLITKPWKGNKATTVAEQTSQEKQPAVSPSASETEKVEAPKVNSVEEKKDNVSSTVAIDNNLQGPVEKPDATNSLIKEPLSLRNNSNRKNTTTIPSDIALLNPIAKESKIKKNQPAANADNHWWQKKEPTKEPAAPVTVKATDPVTNGNVDKTQDKTIATNNSPVVNPVNQVVIEPAKTNDIQKETQPLAHQTEKKAKNKSKKGNSFFFSLSAGPDVSFVGNDKLGTTKLFVGAGLGYTFNKRFTIRSGFYSGRKVYTASAETYDPPPSFYIYYPYLEKVEANCKVYEIPLSLSYDFSRSSKQNFFASAGISSYLMKREEYNYSYKYTPTGLTYKHGQTINNKNKHYFSGLTLSGGYQRNISPHISVMAEPYVKLPLSGVGYGKVKLNSGGVLFSIAVKPFVAKK